MRAILFPLLMCLLLNGKAQDGFNKFQWFGNTGQALPMGSFSAGSKSNNVLETGLKEDFAQSFRIGFDFYPFKHIGITAGSAIMKFSFDAATFEEMHRLTGLTASYLSYEYTCNKIQVGLTSRFIINRLSFEPKLSVGMMTCAWVFADFYVKSADGAIYRTLSYDIDNKDEEMMWICGNGALNITYDVYRSEGLVLGLHLFSELTFTRPEILQTVVESNSHSDEIMISESTFRQPITFYYYGIGIILKYGRNNKT